MTRLALPQVTLVAVDTRAPLLATQALLRSMAGIDFAREPPGTWLLQHVPWNEATHEIAAVEADQFLAATLGVNPGRACLVVERTTWRSSAPVTHVRLTFPGELMRLVAAFTPTQAGRRRERERDKAG